MGEESEGQRITELDDGQFSFHYANYDPDLLEFFDALDLQGGGDTWAALARAGLALSQPPQIGAAVEFDPDAQELFAYSASRAALEALEEVIQRIAADEEFREQCLVVAEENRDIE